MNEIKCGRIGMSGIVDISQRVAMVLAEHKKPLAVCLAPSGHVTVESPKYAIDSDMVGVYQAVNDPAAFQALLCEDILAAQAERNITGGRTRRHIAESNAANALRYTGKPCNKCGGTERYATSMQCCACSNARRAEAKRHARAKVAA